MRWSTPVATADRICNRHTLRAQIDEAFADRGTAQIDQTKDQRDKRDEADEAKLEDGTGVTRHEAGKVVTCRWLSHDQADWHAQQSPTDRQSHRPNLALVVGK